MTRLLVILGFIVAFGAGLVVGMKPRHTPPGPPPPKEDGGWLAAELHLTRDQQDQMKKIWSGLVTHGGRQQEERQRELVRQRDTAIAGLIRPEDKPRYDQVLKDYEDKSAALDRECHESFRNAVERTKQILTPEQRAKYEELLRHHEWDRGPRDGHRGPRGRDRRGERPASRPASQP